MSTAIDRIKSALVASGHPRGVNGTRHRVQLGPRLEKIGVRQPCVELAAADLAEAAGALIGPIQERREREDADRHARQDAEHAAMLKRHEQAIAAHPPEAMAALLQQHTEERRELGGKHSDEHEQVRQVRIRENLVSGKRVPMDLHMGAAEMVEFGTPAQMVYIHVDDAWHLVEAAEAAAHAAATLQKSAG